MRDARRELVLALIGIKQGLEKVETIHEEEVNRLKDAIRAMVGLAYRFPPDDKTAREIIDIGSEALR